MLSSGEMIIEALTMLEIAIGGKLPILNMLEIADSYHYVQTGAMQAPFFLVCNKDELAEVLNIKLKERREWMQSLSAGDKEPESDQ